MSTQNKANADLFHKDQAESVAARSYDNESTKKADAALKSSRPRKSAAAFRTISEVADELGVQQHVLRFWETKFSQVKPLKRGGGRRYYRPEDISLLQAVHNLLYVEGYTIKGVQKLLREVGKKQIVDNFSDGSTADNPISRSTTASSSEKTEQQTTQAQKTMNKDQRKALETVLAELKELRGMIKPGHS